jgi:hypothetical protein
MKSRSTYNKKEITQVSVSATNWITAAKYYLRGGPTGPVSELLDNRFLFSLVPWKAASCRRRPWNQRLTTFTCLFAVFDKNLLQVWSSIHDSTNKQGMLFQTRPKANKSEFFQLPLTRACEPRHLPWRFHSRITKSYSSFCKIITWMFVYLYEAQTSSCKGYGVPTTLTFQDNESLL